VDDRRLLHAILAISLLSLLVSLYVLYTLKSGQGVAIALPANMA